MVLESYFKNSLCGFKLALEFHDEKDVLLILVNIKTDGVLKEETRKALVIKLVQLIFCAENSRFMSSNETKPNVDLVIKFKD